MPFDFERIFVRFRGRVLGPMTRSKFEELVRRGQIAKDYEISPDGIAWKLAGDYPDLFGEFGREASAERSTPTQQHVSTRETNDWYVNMDGQSRGPYAKETLKTWYETGLLKAETPVWIEGLPDWTTAGLAFKDWFEVASLPSPVTPTTNHEFEQGKSFPKGMAASSGWITLLAILGLVTCFFGAVMSLYRLGIFAMSDFELSRKVRFIFFEILRLLATACWIASCFMLLSYASRLRRTSSFESQEYWDSTVQAHNQLWKRLGIFALVGMVLNLFTWLAQALLSMILGAVIMIGVSDSNHVGNLVCGLFV